MSKFNFIYAEDLSHREKTVYIYLRDRADASGVCWPGIKTIAGELGLSPRTVQRALADLEHRQLIEKRQRDTVWCIHRMAEPGRCCAEMPAHQSGL